MHVICGSFKRDNSEFILFALLITSPVKIKKFNPAYSIKHFEVRFYYTETIIIKIKNVSKSKCFIQIYIQQKHSMKKLYEK